MNKTHNERNAGRKPLPVDERKVKINICLNPETFEKLKSVDNRSGLINDLLQKYFNNIVGG